MWLSQGKAIALNMPQAVLQRCHCPTLFSKNKIQDSGILNFKPAPKTGTFWLEKTQPYCITTQKHNKVFLPAKKWKRMFPLSLDCWLPCSSVSCPLDCHKSRVSLLAEMSTAKPARDAAANPASSLSKHGKGWCCFSRARSPDREILIVF